MPNEKPGAEVKLGKKFSGEKFSTVRSAEETAEQVALNVEYGSDPEAIPLSVYFTHKRVNDPTHQRMMESYTKVRNATLAAFDAIFKDF